MTWSIFRSKNSRSSGAQEHRRSAPRLIGAGPSNASAASLPKQCTTISRTELGLARKYNRPQLDPESNSLGAGSFNFGMPVGSSKQSPGHSRSQSYSQGQSYGQSYSQSYGHSQSRQGPQYMQDKAFKPSSNRSNHSQVQTHGQDHSQSSQGPASSYGHSYGHSHSHSYSEGQGYQGHSSSQSPVPVPLNSRLSFNSVRSSSSRSESIRSFKSASGKSAGGSIRARQIRAAHAAKRAAAQYIAAHRENPLVCYTCGQQISDVRCKNCRTSYLPPEFKFNASSAAIFNLDENWGGGGYAGVKATVSSSSASTYSGHASSGANIPSGAQGGVNGSGASASNISVSNVSISGAASFIGFYHESEDDSPDTNSELDFELIADLASLGESGLLEAVVFDCFSSIENVARTFYRGSEPIEQQPQPSDDEFYEDGFPYGAGPPTPPRCDSALDSLKGGSSFALASTQTRIPRPASPPLSPTADLAPDDSGDLTAGSAATARSPLGSTIVDTHAVKKFYNLIGSISSTAPMRGVLQGAQLVLQTRKHAPITEKELAFICVVLQCPAISDCSMFTKITGPLQKLSRYAGLRSRARTMLEICAGLIVHSNEDMHPLFSKVFASVDQETLENTIDLCNAYVSHRLSFDFHYKSRTANAPSKFQLVKHDWYVDDWRISVVVRFMALLWEANKLRESEKTITNVPASRFYNTMVDLVDLKSDFDVWQAGNSRKKPRFCFCRYPFLLSMGSKSSVFEHSVQRIVNAEVQREMFALMANYRRVRANMDSQDIQLASLRTFTMRVRRQQLLEDSVKRLSEWPEYQRRAFKVEFESEPGVDAGGLKKEWFLMFYRQLFAPELKVFVMDETSNYCWFGNHEDKTYYQVAGIALGLALFNSITVDLNLPLLVFKLLLDYPYDLNDIGKLWPDIAQSLQNILDYDDEDFEDVFGLTFVAPDGTPLLANGDALNVTLSSKEMYVSLLVEHLVNADGPSFQSFKNAFLSVCGGNAITLFQPEELELLARGDRKPIDVRALRSVTKYVNFGHRYDKANIEPVVQWFWDYFEKLDPISQARLLQFVTATDRPPAAGMVQMRFSIMCLGGDSDRLPIAHTCFNQLGLYKYKSRRKLETKLSLAIVEYQGFGLK